MHASNTFTLYGGNDAFAGRQKKLFDQLSIAEKECNRERSIDTDIAPMDIESFKTEEVRRPFHNNKKRKSEMRQFRGKESIFKRPEGPAPRNNSRSIPDYHRNPHKWMKYSLDDVSTDDMTDRSNARTAFAFLKELETRRRNESSGNIQDSEPPMEHLDQDMPFVSQTPSFKKPKQSANIQFKKLKTVASGNRQSCAVIATPEEKPMFLSTKVLMPEYVVGQKQKRKGKAHKGTLAIKIDRTKELKLNHLEELEDEDEDV